MRPRRRHGHQGAPVAALPWVGASGDLDAATARLGGIGEARKASATPAARVRHPGDVRLGPDDVHASERWMRACGKGSAGRLETKAIRDAVSRKRLKMWRLRAGSPDRGTLPVTPRSDRFCQPAPRQPGNGSPCHAAGLPSGSRVTRRRLCPPWARLDRGARRGCRCLPTCWHAC